MSRGPGAKFNFYSEGVHQDYGWGPRKYYDSVYV